MTPTSSYKSSEIAQILLGSRDGIDSNEVEERFDSLERELRYLYRHAPFGLHTLDANNVFLSINDQELAWLGYTQEEVVGRLKFTDLLTPNSKKRYKSHLANYLKSGFTEDVDLSLIAKNKTIRHVTLYSNNFISSDGLLIKHRSVLFNIDERKTMEAQLNIADIAFESQEGRMVTDANYFILRVNQAFTSITGYSAQDAIGQTPNFLNSGRQDKKFYREMWKSLNSSGGWEGEVWNRRKNGEVYPEHLTITAVRDSAGSTTHYVAELNDISEKKAASNEIENLAFYDTLTQLPNRRLLLDRLSQALVGSARNTKRGALLLLDLDRFKTLNETLGHDFGDLLLQMVAARLQANVRDGDTVARIGGDEFVVVLEDLSNHAIEAAAQAKDIAEKISVALNQPYLIKSHTYHSSSSIGATLFNGHELMVDELLKQADIAMYQSKTEGRNTLRFFDPMMQDAITARADLESELRKAIELQQFQLNYQIQVGSTGQILGAEALIRWHHPERGIISPIDFIPLAEETGLMLPIGNWVLNTVCAQLSKWQKTLFACNLVIAVNVSAMQFHQIDFVEKILEMIKQYEISPTRLKIELTESMLVDNIKDIVTKMTALSKIGITFSLDDFGTGYSSLQYLKMLPLNQLKIDQSFVHDIATHSSNRAIVRTIITMAHGLDINVIAEGVETSEQQQFLLDNGCTHYQGYLFSKPLPIADFESLLNKV